MDLVVNFADAVALSVFLAAAVVVLSIPVSETGPVGWSAKLFLVAACAVYVVVMASDVLDEHSIRTVLENIEESVEILWVPFLLFAVYSLYGKQQLRDTVAAHDAAARADRLVSDVIATAQSGVMTLDVEGHVVFANDVARSILSLGSDERPEAAADRVVRSADPARPLPIAAGFRCLVGDREMRDLPVVVEWRGNQRRRISVSVVPLRDADGTTTGALATFVDRAPWLRLRA